VGSRSLNYNSIPQKGAAVSVLFGVLFAAIFFILYFYIPTAFFFSLTDPLTLPFFLVFILVTPVTLLYAFKYCGDELRTFTFFVFFILLLGFGLFFVDSILIFFFMYEALLLPSFFILYLYAKTRRAVEAAFLMFF
jgi:formate hydrogenlyase subunit 3/multisubunit Na+/H+ antiporter MnhD subunit